MSINIKSTSPHITSPKIASTVLKSGPLQITGSVSVFQEKVDGHDSNACLAFLRENAEFTACSLFLYASCFGIGPWHPREMATRYAHSFIVTASMEVTANFRLRPSTHNMTNLFDVAKNMVSANRSLILLHPRILFPSCMALIPHPFTTLTPYTYMIYCVVYDP